MIFGLSDERLIHSIKTGLACLIGFLFAKLIHVQVGQWLIITILVVMCAQVNVGSMIQKSYMRFLGTLIGSIAAAFTLLLFGTEPLVVAIIICLSAMIFSYIATSPKNINEAGTLGAVTVAIILINPHPTFFTVLERFFEIGLGILIAALISQFVLPIHARKHLRLSQARTFRQLRAYYLATLLTEHSDEENYHDIDENIIKSLIAQRKLAIEAAREPFSNVHFMVKTFNVLLPSEREILRAITFMHHAYESSPETKKIFSSMQLITEFHDKICDTLANIATYVEKKRSKPLKVSMPSIIPIKNHIKNSHSKLSEEDIIYTNAFLFCAEILIEHLTHIAKVIQQ